MSIANLQEKLLFFTRQKSRIGQQLSNLQITQLSAAKKSATQSQAYNAQLQNLYYDDQIGYLVNPDAYSVALEQLQNEHEFEMASIIAWESELDAQKENLETQLNEINGYESAWQKLLMANIKSDFAYGSLGK